MKITFPNFCIILLMILSSCSRTGEHKLALTFSVLSNTVDSTGNSRAICEFLIKNNSEQALEASNWSLYFSLLPAEIEEAPTTETADVVHINGDWYKLVPRNNFYLKAGDSTRIQITSNSLILKESYFPKGPYFVIYDEEGKEKQILKPEPYLTLPLTTEAQLGPLLQHEKYNKPGDSIISYQDSLPSSFFAEELKIIPSPANLVDKGESTELNDNFLIVAGQSLEKESNYLRNKLEELINLPLKQSTDNEINRGIILLFDSTSSPESYTLSIHEERIEIRGDSTGVFYGIQSLLQLIDKEDILQKSGRATLPQLTIKDQPRFGYRGLHIDVARNFQPNEQIMKTIDLMALYKFNTLNLCLTDDEGWRLEIASLPELTSVGGKRGHISEGYEMLPPAYGSGGMPWAEDNQGTGYYSREDFIDILRYADERHIQVIPLINFPGHARAAIIAMENRYKKLMEEGKKEEAQKFRLIDPNDKSQYRSAQWYNDNVVCVARESVYTFYAKVIEEVAALYSKAGAPLNMIHTGGDEVPEGAWTASPISDTLMSKTPGISEPANLQVYFFRRINDILSKHGITAGGWEEVALKKFSSDITLVNPEFADEGIVPYIWNNLWDEKDLAYRVANAGYNIILCPVSAFYFDLAYNADPDEPGFTWGGYNNTYDAWSLDPFEMYTDEDLVKLEPLAKDNILGLQGQLWSETIQGTKMMEYYLLPKMLGLAERAWAAEPEWMRENNEPAQDSAWNVFRHKIKTHHLPRLDLINGGYNYREME